MSKSQSALTPARLEAIKAQVRPGAFLKRFGELIEQEGSALLETLFLIAKGNVLEQADGKRMVTSDVKDSLTALKIIMEMGAFKEVMKHLLKVSQKGRPGQEEETPPWMGEYADLLEGSAPPPPPPKKPE